MPRHMDSSASSSGTTGWAYAASFSITVAIAFLIVGLSTNHWVQTTIYLGPDELISAYGLFKTCEDVSMPCTDSTLEEFTCLDETTVRPANERRARRDATVAFVILAVITLFATLAAAMFRYLKTAAALSLTSFVFLSIGLIIFAQTEMSWKTCGHSMCDWNRPVHTPCRYELHWSFWLPVVAGSISLVVGCGFTSVSCGLHDVWTKYQRMTTKEELTRREQGEVSVEMEGCGDDSKAGAMTTER